MGGVYRETPYRPTTTSVEKAPLMGSCRLTFTMCAFATLFNLILMRYNLSFALVCMVSDTSADFLKSGSSRNFSEDGLGKDGCPVHQQNPGSAVVTHGEFEWSKAVQGRVLSGFFYGYVASQALGGWASDRWGGKRLFVLGNLLQSVATLLLPAAARLHHDALFALRLLQGLVCGFSLPSVYQLYTRWAAPEERTALMGVAYTGFPLANVVIFPLSGVLCQATALGGWPSIFYVTGAFGFVCSVVCWFLVYENANEHPRISAEEREYLNAVAVKETGKPPSIPWGSVLRSGPVMAYLVAHFCYSWGFVTLAVNLPLFMKEVLFFDLHQNGMLSALPYLGVLVVRIIVSLTFTGCQKRTGLSLTNLRKLNHTVGTLGAAASLLGVASLSCQQQFWAVLVLTAGQAVTDLAFTGGYVLSFLDLAPRLAGTLTGAANALGNLPGVLAPTMVGYLTTNGTREEWTVVLYVTAAFYVVGAAVYLVLGSSEQQPWAPGDAKSPPDIEMEPLQLPEKAPHPRTDVNSNGIPQQPTTTKLL
ncbi:uncharacterized transporter slc-17.2-like [Schistocerca americana]|uniref:uncharacterized transporter slc-17.2-like n=1 Tax=Schistocerca americana TaxID=7009 RepID=UPI001F5025F9|nr:uncharacterized transporter slc-17.2-like [Schistocerca americana]XP_046997067.1 uncharacterized transporter slc-17.2-like [Schistocerca americana]XP_046997068.1 uncharacterized transporter slc-17.2-like [Schistocerca americana]